MSAVRYWEKQKEEVLSKVKEAEDRRAVLSIFQAFWEEARVDVLAAYKHEDVLRQQINLLFKQAGMAAEMMMIQNEPAVTIKSSDTPAARKIPESLQKTLPIYAASGFGLCLSMFSGGNAWQFALMFLVIVAITYTVSKRNARQPQSSFEVETTINLLLFDNIVSRQVQLIDAHISDLQALHSESLQPTGDVMMDRTSISLCQYVWANAKQGYPVESTLMMAEKLMAQNDMEWVFYEEAHKNYFDVMPTKKSSRMVFPALRKISDGTMICKGQYLKMPE